MAPQATAHGSAPSRVCLLCKVEPISVEHCNVATALSSPDVQIASARNLFFSPPCLERVTRIGLGALPEAGQDAHIVTKLRGLWLSNQNLGLYEKYRGLSKILPDLTRDTRGLL